MRSESCEFVSRCIRAISDEEVIRRSKTGREGDLR
jgi:hypothetical protein